MLQLWMPSPSRMLAPPRTQITGAANLMPVVRSIHQRIAKRNRGLRSLVYHDQRWRGVGGTRQRVIDHANGWCEIEGCGAPATIADHWPLPLRALLEQGLDPYDPARCRALCAHHSGKADGARS
jgi:hypothetical protein